MQRRALLALALIAALWGCTGVEPVVLSAGASAAREGVTIFKRGKSKSFLLAGLDETLRELRVAAADLFLVEVSCQVDPPQQEGVVRRARLHLRDERGQSIVVNLERRTESVTLVRTSVGTFGEVGLATLLLRRTFDTLGAPVAP